MKSKEPPDQVSIRGFFVSQSLTCQPRTQAAIRLHRTLRIRQPKARRQLNSSCKYGQEGARSIASSSAHRGHRQNTTARTKTATSNIFEGASQRTLPQKTSEAAARRSNRQKSVRRSPCKTKIAGYSPASSPSAASSSVASESTSSATESPSEASSSSEAYFVIST